MGSILGAVVQRPPLVQKLAVLFSCRGKLLLRVVAQNELVKYVPIWCVPFFTKVVSCCRVLLYGLLGMVEAGWSSGFARAATRAVCSRDEPGPSRCRCVVRGSWCEFPGAVALAPFANKTS